MANKTMRKAEPTGAQVRLAGYPDAENIIGLDDLARSDRIRVNFIHEKVASRSCYVATLDDEIVGYAVLEYTFFEKGLVSMILVAPEHRRRGAGTRLMRFLEQHCKSEKLFVMANRSDETTQGLMNKLQYVRSGKIDNLKEESQLLFFTRLEGRR